MSIRRSNKRKSFVRGSQLNGIKIRPSGTLDTILFVRVNNYVINRVIKS